jgi:hypothetical protein
MAGNIGLPSNADITELFTSVETAWNSMDFSRDVNAEKLAYFRTSARGYSTTFAFSNVSSKPIELLDGADRQFAKAEIFKVSVPHIELVPEASLEISEKAVKLDLYNLVDLQSDANNVLAGARDIWITQLASAMIANGLAFDGVSLFNTAHPINPLKPGLGTYSNDLTGLDLDEAGLTTAEDVLLSTPAFDGQIDQGRVRKMIIVVPSRPLYYKAQKLVGLPIGSIIPTGGTVAGTSVAATSPFMSTSSDRYEVVYVPQLAQFGGATAKKQWYLMNASDNRRGLIVSVVEPPVLDVEGPGSHIHMLRLAYRMSWHALGGAGPGLPREIIRVTTP